MEQSPSCVRQQTGMLWGVAPVNRLALVPADRVIEGNGQGSQSPRRFLDFEVDGQSLYAEFYRRGCENVGVIWLDLDEPESSSEVQRATSSLLGEQPGDAPGGRVPL